MNVLIFNIQTASVFNKKKKAYGFIYKLQLSAICVSSIYLIKETFALKGGLNHLPWSVPKQSYQYFD